MKLKTIIVDDELPARNIIIEYLKSILRYLISYISDYQQNKPYNICIKP